MTQQTLPFLQNYLEKQAAEGELPGFMKKKKDGGGGEKNAGGNCSSYSRNVGANMVCDKWRSRMKKEGAEAPPGYRKSDSAKQCSACASYSDAKK